MPRWPSLERFTDRHGGDLGPEQQPRLIALARAHGLSSYDATYLDLAQRLGATLASFDRKLNQAAADLGVPLFD